jgi:hypothetical protein
MKHPENEELLRYADGESSAASSTRIRAHLKACWQCRAELDELQSTISECVRYRKNVLDACLPSPPAPWTDIYGQFAEIDAQLDQGGFWNRFLRALQAPIHNLNKWAPIAVALILVSVLFNRFRQTPSVQASELLRKAIAAADARTGKPRQIRIRTKDRRVTRSVGAGATLISNDADSAALQAMFSAARYDWTDPLSAKSHQAWRDGLADKRDEVVEDGGAYRIRTTAPSGELVAATLTIRSQDLQPVQERLEFRNQEWIEITELAGNTAPALGAIAASAVKAAPAVSPVQTPAPVESASATISDELRVVAALHQVGADLGDPIEVSRSGGRILVAGLGITPQRQQEIQAALRSQSHVILRLSDSLPTRVEPDRDPAPDTAVSAGIERLQARIAGQLGGRVYFAQLAAQVLDLSEPMMSRAHALRRLAEQFSPQIETELAPLDWQLLRSLQREHSQALRLQAAEIEKLLKPSLGSTSAPPDVTLSSAWRPATEELFQSARRIDRLLAVVFGAATGEEPGEQLPSQLLSGLAQLRTRLALYDRLIAMPTERERK